MLSGPPRRRRARPVGDAPIEPLLLHAEDLAKGWLLALLEQAPLDAAPAILATELSRDGPRLCVAVLRAITDDDDLRRLEPGGALIPLAARVGALAGAVGPESTSHAVQALQAVIWRALRDQLRDPDPDLIAELAERLTRVTELLRSAALSSGGAGEISSEAEVRPEPEVGRGSAGAAGSDVSGEPEVPPPSVDAPIAEDPRGAAAQSPPPRRWPREASPEPPSQALWVGALQEEIARSAGAPLSLLLAELEDAEHVEAAEPDAVVSSTFGEFARAVRGAVRRQDILVCETDTRAWIIARDTGRAGAQALGSRVAKAVRDAPLLRGAPLTASVGVAVLGEDGRSPDELIDAAEEARFAAEANGVGVNGEGPD